MTGVNGTERRAAVEAWRAAAADGRHLTGTELAERFGRSPGWGRGVIREARQGLAVVPAVAAAPQRHDELAAVPVVDVDRAAERHDGLPRHDSGTDGTTSRPWYDSAIVLVVAAVAAAASYGHMAHVAVLAGEPAWIAHVFPVTVDGLVLAALRRGERGRAWLALGLVVSVGANVLAQFPDVAAQAGPVVSAWPPLALFGTHALLRRR